MKGRYRVYKNGECVARACRTQAVRTFERLCIYSNPYDDIVILVDPYGNNINTN